MEIRPAVYASEVEWGYDEPLGVQVIETEDGAMLFGAGTEGTAEAVIDIAQDHGVDAVVVEHGDADHFGGVPALREAIDDIEVAVPAGDAGFLEDAGIPVDRPLEAGETYRGFETISVPGHTPDNMAYRDEDVLVAGDTVVGADSPFAADGDWSGPFAVCTADYNADDARARDSVATLADHDFEAVLLSHGDNVIEGGRAAVERLIDDLE
jgi:glyoxylase-like metal-dependent hydrolase (beta-lactamase superfamily II)